MNGRPCWRGELQEGNNGAVCVCVFVWHPCHYEFVPVCVLFTCIRPGLGFHSGWWSGVFLCCVWVDVWGGVGEFHVCLGSATNNPVLSCTFGVETDVLHSQQLLCSVMFPLFPGSCYFISADRLMAHLCLSIDQNIKFYSHFSLWYFFCLE